MCFLYVDNEGAKFSLMKGSSENHAVDVMAQIFAEVETHVKTLCWLARVSSFSNIADAPSRGDCSLLKRLQFRDVSLDATACLENICTSMEAKLGREAGRAKPKELKQSALQIA